MSTNLSTREVAEQLHTDQTTVRRFLRTIMPDEAPGTGRRWTIHEDDLPSLRERYLAMHQHDKEVRRILSGLHSELDRLEDLLL